MISVIVILAIPTLGPVYLLMLGIAVVGDWHRKRRVRLALAQRKR